MKARGKTKDGVRVEGWYCEIEGRYFIAPAPYDSGFNGGSTLTYHIGGFNEIDPETLAYDTGMKDKDGTPIFGSPKGSRGGDYCVMDCWNGGDGITEPNNHDIFEGLVVYDQRIARWGLQTKLGDDYEIEVGLENNRFTTIEIIGPACDG
jgi:hypothetical protein